MNLTKLFNRTLGGKTRARVAQVFAVILWVASIVSSIRLDAPIGVTILALIQTLAHDTPLGDKAP